KKRLWTSVISAPVALALLAGILLWHLRVERLYVNWLEGTGRTLNAVQSIGTRVLNAQDELGKYLGSADPVQSAALARALNETGAVLKTLQASASINSADHNRLAEISAREGSWAAAIHRMMNGGPHEALTAQAALAQLNPITQSLLASLDDFIDSHAELAHSGSGQRHAEQTLVSWLVPISAMAVALALMLISWTDIGSIVHEYKRILEDSEQANLRTNHFLDTVSHELRNQLNLIMLWSRLLLSGEREGEGLKRGLNSIDRAAQVQAQLIEDLLDFAKIESGRLLLELRPTDLQAVVKAAVDTVAAAAEARSIDLRVIIDPQAAMIQGDPQRLQQALWNLLSNAVKFTPPGGTVQVQLARIDSQVELTVSDTGQGIAASFLPHVFDRLWQADAPAHAEKKGVGLGLTIVKYIVTMHGGTIGVQSDGLGRGATFSVRLPIVTEGARSQRRANPTIVTTPDLAHIPRLNGLRIIVVDDDQEATEALRGLLKSLGAEPIVADGAERALQLLSEHTPDAIVSDIAMPGRDGLSLAREIRERENHAHSGHLPLVALTAYGRVEDKLNIFSAGFDSHVIKPVDPAELAGVIRSMLEEPVGDKV
ncbi:MAG TPA: ATP-binding protein, partial [Candidatus Binataceae bacterium]